MVHAWTRGNRKRILAATAVVTVAFSGTGVALAASEDADHRRGPAGGERLITGEATGGGCRMGYDTQTSTLIPPDDSTGDNVPAGRVRLDKPCQGAVVGTLSAEASTPAAADFIHVDMRATCVARGGFSDPCTVGQQVFASPGHSFLRNGTSSFGVSSITMVWSDLKRGDWRFEALPGGNNSANLQFRTFVVEAFSGG